MTSFDFAAPTSVAEAVRLLAAGKGTRPLAGGTDLLVQISSGRLAVTGVVDIKRIPEITGISRRGGGFAIGAGTSCAALGEDAELGKAWPGVVEAANLIGSSQIQSRATIAGNLCNASPAADSVPALIAAGATCVIVGPAGKREISVEQMAVAPGRNSLEPGEFVLEILLPARPAQAADAYLRAIPRTEMDIAVAGAGVSLVLGGDGTCTKARVALGAVAPTAILVPQAANALVGTRLDDSAMKLFEAAVREACRPIADKRGTVEYRTSIAAVLAGRAAKIAYQRAEKNA